MGGNASTRRVVVEDTGGEEYITISEAVARRLKGQPSPDTTRKASEVPSASPSQTSVTEPEPMKTTILKTKEVDDFYTNKLQELQERNAALQKITNEQFANAVKEVEHKFLNVTASPVCQDLQSKVLDCYQSYPGEILNCSALVSAFTTCVDRARMDLIMTHIEEEKMVEMLKKPDDNA